MVNKCNLGGYFGFFPHTKKDKILPVIAFLAGSDTLILVKKTGLHIQNLDKKIGVR